MTSSRLKPLAAFLLALLPITSLLAQEVKVSVTEEQIRSLADYVLEPALTPTGRQAACMQLARLGPLSAPAAPALVEALGDEEVSRYAAQALVAIGPEAAKPVAEALWGLNPRRQLAARKVLWAMGPDAKPAMPVLVKMLRGKPEHQRIAVDIIDALGPHAAAAGGVLLDLRHHKDSAIAPRAESALARMDLGGTDLPRPLPVSLRAIALAEDPAERPRNVRGVVPPAEDLYEPTVADARQWLQTGEASKRLRAVRVLEERLESGGEVIQALREALSDKNRDVRASAAIALAENDLHDVEVLAVLREGMRRRGMGTVKAKAAAALAKVAPDTPDLIDRLMEAADSTIPNAWRYGLLGLKRLGHKAKPAEAILARHLRNPDRRESALMLLTELRPFPKDLPEEMTKLIDDARYGKGPERLAAIGRLAEMGPEIREVAVMSLAIIAHRGREPQRREAVEALAVIAPDDPVAIGAVMATIAAARDFQGVVLSADHMQTAIAALEALSRMKPPAKETVELLAPFVSGQIAGLAHQERLNAAVLKVATNLGPEVVPNLRDLVHKEAVPEWRVFGIRVLEKLAPHDPEAWAALVTVAEDQRLLHSRGEAVRAIGRIPAPPADVVPVLARRLADKDPEVRRSALEMLGALGPAAGDAAVAVAHATREDPHNYVQAIVALLQISPQHPSLTQLLPEALSPHADEESRLVAVQKLHLLGEAAADIVPLLEKMLGSSSSDLRNEVVIALGKMRPATAAVPVLLKVLDSNDNDLRILATKSLAQIGPDAAPAAGRLSRMVDNRFVAVRRAAASALLQVNPQDQHLAAAYLAAVRHRDAQVRDQLLPHLRSTPASIDQLLPALTKVADSDPDPHVRHDARAALAILTPGEDQP